MRMNSAVFPVIIYVAGSLVGVAGAQTVGCPSVDQYRQAYNTGNVPTASEASTISDQMLAELNNDPQGPCADGIRRVLIGSLDRAGREPEAMAVAESGARLGRDYRSRCMFANNSLALRMEIEGRNLSPASEALCRQLAVEVLDGAPNFEARLAAPSMGTDLSTELVLYHVIATTEPTAALRIEEMGRLVAFVRAADARERATGRSNAFEFELATLIPEFISMRLAEGEAIPHSELVDLCGMPTTKLDRMSACKRALTSPTLSRERKLQLLDGLSATLDPVMLVREKYGQFAVQFRATNVDADHDSARTLLAEADALWLVALAVEQQDPPADPSSPRVPDALESTIKGLLYDRCELGLRVLKDPAYIPAGQDYKTRFQDGRASRLDRWIQVAAR